MASRKRLILERKFILVIIGITTISLRLLLDSQFGTSTLVYILIPFAVSIAIAFATKRSEKRSFFSRYLNHMRLATIVFLASSVLLFEGFICVLMFMPIYYLFVSIGYYLFWLMRDKSQDGSDQDDLKNTFQATAIPVLILMLMSEGLFSATTVPRPGTATYVADSQLSVEELQHNIAQPIAFDSERHWFLKLFPMPDAIAAGTLNQGDTHTLNFTYKRWLFTNTHSGEMHVKIAKVSDDHIRTEITRNDSYLDSYMRIDGTDIRFTPLAGGGTRVALSVRYDRRLDPAWYFGPMQQLAAKQSARLFLSDIVFRHPVEEVRDRE
ncbi:MAG: hypothetical protein ABJP48_11180 [Erythrobacter sp.]